MAARKALIIASSLGLIIAASRPASMAMAKKARRNQRPAGEAEGDIAHPQHRIQTEPLLHQPDRREGLHGPFLLGADRQGQAVDKDVPGGDPLFPCRVQ